MQGDVDGAVDVGLRVLGDAPDVEDLYLAVVTNVAEVGEVGALEGRGGIGPLLGASRGAGRDVVDADAHQLALRFGDLFARLAQQRDRRAPGDHPADVGGDLSLDAEVEAPRHVAGGVGHPVAQIHHPLALLEPAPDLILVRAGGLAQVRRVRAGGVRRRHVGVVGGVDVEAGEDLLDPVLLVLGQHRVDPLLTPDRRLGALGLGGGAEAPEAVRGHDLGVIGELRGQPVRRVVLVPDELVGVGRSQQIRAPRSAEEQRTTAEHDLAAGVLVVRGGIEENVGEVGERVAGRGEGLHRHGRADLDNLGVDDGGALERHLVLGVDVVVRAAFLGQRVSAGHVVVVDVGLEDRLQCHTLIVEDAGDAVDVALGVDDERELAVVDDIAAVAEGGGLDGDDRRHGALLRFQGVYTPGGIRRPALGDPTAVHRCARVGVSPRRRGGNLRGAWSSRALPSSPR